MIEHHHYLLLLLSVPWNLGIAYDAKKAMEDEDVNFVFKFISCKNWNCSQFHLVWGWVTKNRV
jgi:hypothetical protein